jgi:hypothetical protein
VRVLRVSDRPATLSGDFAPLGIRGNIPLHCGCGSSWRHRSWFFLDQHSLGYRVLWPFTLIVMGITGLAGVHIGTALQFSRRTRILINKIALVAFVSYVLIVVFVRRDFLIAILGYFPALIFIGAGFFLAYLRQRRSPLLIGFFGICLMLFAAAVQQAKLGVNPRYFDHNALYHLLQAIALFMVFLAARAAIMSGEFIE